MPDGVQVYAENDVALRRFRERVSALFGGIIIVGTMYLLAYALYNVGDATTLDRAKELLTFINPIFGVVIGYYFTKVTAEARAERAEQQAQVNAQTATTNAETAAAAQRQAQNSDQEAEAARAHLDQVTTEARGLLEQLAPASMPEGVAADMGGPGRAVTLERARTRLETVLAMTDAARRR